MSYDGTLSFGTVLDLKGLKEGMKKLEGFLKQNQGFFTSVTDSMDATQLLEQKLTALTGSSEAAQAAMAALGASLEGTGYSLGTAAAAMDALVTHGMGLETATATMAAWGDAVAAYAGGSNTALASVSNTLADLQAAGSVSMSHVNALLDAGVPVVETYAAAVGTSMEEARTALSSGEVSAGSFFAVMNGAIEQGAAGLPALAGAASAANLTWSGAFTSMQDSVGRGVAAILTSIDEANTSVGRPELKQGVENLGKAFESVMTGAAQAITPVIKKLDYVVPSVLGVIGVFKAAKVVTTILKAVNTATNLYETAQRKAKDSTEGVALATHKQIAAAREEIATQKVKMAAAQAGIVLTETEIKAQAASVAVTKDEIAAQLASTGAVGAKTLVLGGLSTGMGVATVATTLLKGAMNALSNAVSAMGGPVGIVLALLPLFATGISHIITFLNKGSPAFQEQKTAVEAAASAYEDFSTSVADAKKSYENSQSSFQAQKQNAKKLTDALTTLSGKENKSAADKAALAETVALLNNQFDGLNLTIDEQTGALSQSAEEVAAYVQAQQQISNSEAVLQRHNELLQEQQEAERQLQELQAQRQEIETQFNEGAFGDGKRKELLESLAESEAGYLQQKQEITAELDGLNAGQAASEAAAAQAAIDAAEAKAAAEAESAQRRTDSITSFAEASTNMFEAINTESDVSAEKMLENLQHNKEAMENYQTNLTKLRDRFKDLKIDDAVIDQFANMGTEGMAYIQALADGSDDVLIGIAESMPENIEAGNAAGERAWQEGYAKMYDGGMGAAEAGTEGYTDGAATLPDAATTSITETKEATDAAVEDAGFDDDGKKIVSKVANGCEENTDELTDAASDSVKDAYTAADKAVKNTAFDSIGSTIVRKIAHGIGENWGLIQEVIDARIAALAIAGGGKRVYGESDQKNPASKPRAVGVEWAPHPWVAMGLVSEELMNAKIPNAAEVVAQMQAGVAMNQARVAAEGAPRAMHHIYTAQLAAAPATSTAKEGGMKVGAINVAIDAKNVKEFNDVVKIAQRAVMSYRQGYVDH